MMKKKRLLAGSAVLSALLLNGCSGMMGGQSSGVVSVNWFCFEEASTGEQTCQKRRMRNGSPVDDEVLETVVIPAGSAPPSLEGGAPVQQPPATAGTATSWDRQPLAKVNAIEDGGGLEVEDIGPQPQDTEQTAALQESRPPSGGTERPFSAVGSANDTENATTVDELSASTHTMSGAGASGEAPVSSDGTPASRSAVAGGYTLQLGAFSSAESCQRFAQEQKSRSLAIETSEILNQGKTWCIVTLGRYASKPEAVAASREYGRQFPSLTFWVRSQASIRELQTGQG